MFLGDTMSLINSSRALRRAHRAAAALLAGLTLASACRQLAFAQAASEPAAACRSRRVAAPAVAKESVDNPYGLKALWTQGDFVARGTLIIMVIMTMGSWYIIFTKLFEQRKLMKSAEAAAKTFWKAGSVKAGIGSLDEGSAFRYIAERASRPASTTKARWSRRSTSTPGSAMSVERAVDNIKSRLQDGLALLATVGSTAPFVGLFGTVWGIYNALIKIGISGQASIDKVAGPVGEALIMTAIGLAVAVPAVMGYNWLIRRNKAVMERVRAFARRPAQRAARRQARADASGSGVHGDAMAMNLASADGDEDQLNTTINTTPLVDVMLVLLIIFLITIPVVTQTIKLELPKERNLPTQTKPENIVIAVNRDGEVYWGMERLPDIETLVARLKKESVKEPQPEVHIRGDGEVRYESVGRVVVACQRAGIFKVGFITEPPAGVVTR